LSSRAHSQQGLVVRATSKRFGSTEALVNVDFSVASGEIVGLMGANGAGKSTLVNILSGVIQPDSGTIELDGERFRPQSPREAIARGVVAIHQATERAGVPGLTVADALVLDRLADGRSGFLVSRGTIRRQAQGIVEKAGFPLDLDRDFGDIGTADRQLVAIARAISAEPQALILDEPTASLSGAEAERLFDIVEDLARRGLAIIYISHRTGDLVRLADRVVVLRGGRVGGEFARPVDFAAALEVMIGRPIDAARPKARAASGRPVLELKGVRLRSFAASLDLDIKAGEVVALTGPLGAGKSRLLQTIFGVHAIASGEIRLDGAVWHPANPADAIAGGVYLAGEDRRRTSFVSADWPGGTIAATIAQPHLPRWFPHGFLIGSRERNAALSAIERLGIVASGPDARLDTLSGGNQQKVVLARWQAERPRVLLLDEPFQGVDVGARADIAAAIRAETDVAVLIATSDPEEAIEVADRIFWLDRAGLRPFSAHQHSSHAEGAYL
jgi:simple sugar transport system ATP-binding protein